MCCAYPDVRGVEGVVLVLPIDGETEGDVVPPLIVVTAQAQFRINAELMTYTCAYVRLNLYPREYELRR